VKATESGLNVEPLTLTSTDIAEDIAAVARVRQVNLVLMGFHRPVIGHAILGGTVHRVMNAAPADVGIFVNRGLDGAKRILVPYLGSPHDRLALELAGRLAKATGAQISVLHVVPPNRDSNDRALGAKTAVARAFAEPGQPSPVEFRVVEDYSPVAAILREAKDYDLVVIGVGEEWGLESQMFGFRPQRIAQDCPTSLLIVRKHQR
jgi:nucleotide-binding universal stress UspA family protein